MGHTWGLYIVLNFLPKFLKEVLHVDVKKNGHIASLPYLLMWIVTVFTGFLSDYLIKRKCLGITFSRKLYTTISAVGPAVFLVLAGYVGCNVIVVITMITLGMGFMGPYFAGVKANSVDLSPNYAGVLMALSNGSGAVMGSIATLLQGEIVSKQVRVVLLLSIVTKDYSM